MANNLPPRIELNGLPGTYYKIYVNGADVVTYPYSFNVGTTPVTVTRSGNLWSVNFVNPQNVTILLTSFTNTHQMFTNMDVYMFSCGSANVFAYMLYLNGNSYIYNYQGVLIDQVINGGYINNWRIVPSLNTVYFNFCNGLNAVSANMDDVRVPFQDLTLQETIQNLQPSNIAQVTLVNGVAVLTNPNLNSTSIIKSIQYVPGGAVGDAIGGFTLSTIVGNSVTVTAGSTTDNSTIVIVW
jgi:hypothetical protein